MGGVSIQILWVVKTAVYAGAKTHCHLTRPCCLMKAMKLKDGCSCCVSGGVGSPGSRGRGMHTGQLSRGPGLRAPRLSKCKVGPPIIIYMGMFPQKFIKEKKKNKNNDGHLLSWQRNSHLKFSDFNLSQWNGEQYLYCGLIFFFFICLHFCKIFKIHNIYLFFLLILFLKNILVHM